MFADFLVPRTRVELTRANRPLPPQSSVSTNSTTWAGAFVEKRDKGKQKYDMRCKALIFLKRVALWASVWIRYGVTVAHPIAGNRYKIYDSLRSEAGSMRKASSSSCA